MKGDTVPDTDHVARYCGGSHLKENGSISGAAFRLRKRDSGPEPYLSVNWLEFLENGNREKEIAEIRKLLSKKLRRVGANAKVAVLNVGKVRNHVSSCSADHRDLHILHEPEDGDPSHSGIHNLKLEDDLIADLVAQTIQETHCARISGS